MGRGEEAEALMHEAGAAFYPAIDLEAGLGRSRSASTAVSGPSVQTKHRAVQHRIEPAL